MRPITYKIFFCFSEEVRNDVNNLKLKLDSLSEDLAYVINLETKSWDDYKELDMHGKDMTLQEFYDKEILKSDLAVFLYKNNWNPNTRHEWNLCLSNTRPKPNILLGIRADSKKNIEEIRKELGHRDVIIDISYLDVYQILSAIQYKIMNKMMARFKYFYKLNKSRHNFYKPTYSSDLLCLIPEMKKESGVKKVSEVKCRIPLLHDSEWIKLSSPKTLADVMAINSIKNKLIKLNEDTTLRERGICNIQGISRVNNIIK